MEDSFKNKDVVNFKFRELKIYSSTEWLADNKKKYRQVFDRFETTYVYTELSFYNKLFDREVWEADIELKCFYLKRQKKELCNLKFKRKISKYDNVVYIREGWGNKKEGVFWKKGTYYWEAWLEGVKVATKYFYIEDAGKDILSKDNPYMSIQSLRLYEGQYDDVNEDDRTYYKAFSSAESRYIYSEIILKNENYSKEWHCELFIKFYNEARELKGQVVRLRNVKKEEPEIKFTAGWGSNVKGSWRPGSYTVELVFMDKLLAIIPFTVGEEYEEGNSPVQISNKEGTIILSPQENNQQTFEEVMTNLTNLIGLDHVKKQVQDHAKYISFLQLRKEKGFEESEKINVHSVFIGNPGTGKTTVATMMGMLYKKMGILSKGHIHEVDRVDLVGEYIGQTAPKVKEAIEKARGGILFIDEAYALARSNDDSKDFGREVIEILVKEMSNGPGDMAVIVAGYPGEMKHFLDSNPGLKSRFKIYYEFSDYLPQELAKIALYTCQLKEVKLTDDAYEKVNEIIIDAFRSRDRSFGNARFVHDLIEKAKINLGLRIMDSSKPNTYSQEDLALIKLKDVEKIEVHKKKALPNIPIDEKELATSLAELDALIGIRNIKKEIHELVDLVKYYRYNDRSVLNNFFLHTIFIGNPGTGKTTVARILTKIYKALGVLERGHMVETDRQGLVAGFVGQTAMKTAQKIEESMGGVLFIDEAYALSSHNSLNDFGNEAIQTILKRMEDHRGEFFIFAAGYPENMEAFLKTNPGLKSRFDKILRFEDYSAEDLGEIASKMIQEDGMNITPKAKNALDNYLKDLYKFRDKYFGNARAVRNIVQQAIQNQNLRLANGGSKIKNNTIAFEDVQNFSDQDNEVFNRKSIGFKNP